MLLLKLTQSLITTTTELAREMSTTLEAVGECVDHIIVLGDVHLRRVLQSYSDDYNSVRTHGSLNKDAPVSRSVQ